MSPNNNSKLNKIIISNNIIAGLIMFVAIILAFFIPFKVVRQTEIVKVDASKGWYYVDNSGMPTTHEADLTDLQFDKNNKVSIITTINSENLGVANLEFISKNIDFSVYLDDELIYDYHPVIPRYSGKSYGNAVHDIVIPNFTGNKNLRIDAEQLGSNLWGRFVRVYFQNGYEYYKELLQENIYKLAMTFVVFVIGIFLAVLAFFFEFRESQKVEAISIGVIAMTMGLYANSDVYMLEIFSSDLGLIRFLNYVSLIFLPIVGLSLVMAIIRCKKSRGFLLVECLVIFNIICHIVIIGGGFGDYIDILLMTHFILVVTVIVAIYHTILAFMSKRIREDSQFVMLIAFGLLMTCGIVDLVFYYTNTSSDVARFSRLGLFVFTVVISFYEIVQFLNMSRKSYEAEIMNKLAHEDGLTGLENRMAFSEYERELSLRPDGLVYIIQLDINYLKKVNDTYGHSAGDKHIKAAAKIINEIYGEYGRIFRTGGDEFIVAMESDAVMNLGRLYRECEKNFEEAIEAYNEKEKPPVKLQIAYGMGEFRCGTDNPEDVEKKADKRMYDHKLRLKEQAEE